MQSIVNDLATIKAGTYTTTATVTHNGDETFGIGHTVTHNGTENFTGIVSISDRLAFPKTVTLSDAPHTLTVGSASSYILDNSPAAQRAITMSTSGPPNIGERIRVVVRALVYNAGVPEPYQFTRTGTPAGLLAYIKTSAVVTTIPVFVEFEWADGDVLAVSGTASGSGGKVRLTVSTTNSLATGDQVVVAGVGGTTEANGTWTITVIDGTHVDLTGTTFVHAWTSGGTAQITPGIWRLAACSGTSYDGANPYGVFPELAS
jgi:hypothetical protein